MKWLLKEHLGVTPEKEWSKYPSRSNVEEQNRDKNNQPLAQSFKKIFTRMVVLSVQLSPNLLDSYHDAELAIVIV